MTEAPDPQTPAVMTERIGPAEVHTLLGHSMGARVFEASTTSGDAATVWSWPSDQVVGAAIPRLLAIIEGLEADAPACLAPILHGSLTADRAVLVFHRPPHKTLLESAGEEPLSPLRALAGCRELVQAILEARERGIRVVRWCPNMIGCPEAQDTSWILLAPGVHGLPSNSSPIPSSLAEAAAVAPELANGEVRVEELDDEALAPLEAYALGATLFYALTGAMPLEAESVGAYRRKQADEPARDLSNMVEYPDRYPQLVRLVQSCLSRRSEERPASLDELTTRLDTCVREARRMASDVAFLPVRFSDSVANLRNPPPPGVAELQVAGHRSQFIVFILLVALLLFVLLFQVTGHAATVPSDATGTDIGAGSANGTGS